MEVGEGSEQFLLGFVKSRLLNFLETGETSNISCHQSCHLAPFHFHDLVKKNLGSCIRRITRGSTVSPTVVIFHNMVTHNRVHLKCSLRCIPFDMYRFIPYSLLDIDELAEDKALTF